MMSDGFYMHVKGRSIQYQPPLSPVPVYCTEVVAPMSHIACHEDDVGIGVNLTIFTGEC